MRPDLSDRSGRPWLIPTGLFLLLCLIGCSLPSPCLAGRLSQDLPHPGDRQSAAAADSSGVSLEDLVQGSRIILVLRSGEEVPGKILRITDDLVELSREKSLGFGNVERTTVSVATDDIRGLKTPRKKWHQPNWLIGAGIVFGTVAITSLILLASS